MKRHLPQFEAVVGTRSSAPPDIHLMILQFSFGVVKGNLNVVSRGHRSERAAQGPMLRRLKAPPPKTLAGS
jgi:hypothetical protein